MIKIKYSSDLMKFMSLFESLTGAKLKDCMIISDIIFFIVEPAQIGLAIGKNGVNIRKLKSILKEKEFRIVEFNPDMLEFVKNLFYPISIQRIELKEHIIEIAAPDMKTRGLLIGRGAINLRNYEAIVGRFFEAKEIRVV